MHREKLAISCVAENCAGRGICMNDLAYYLHQRYRVILDYDPEGYWIARNPELPGCIADGATEQEALLSLSISRELWIESRLSVGLLIPEPINFEVKMEKN
jgi:predicted RNase H-like HicB family nuclease